MCTIYLVKVLNLNKKRNIFSLVKNIINFYFNKHIFLFHIYTFHVCTLQSIPLKITREHQVSNGAAILSSPRWQRRRATIRLSSYIDPLRSHQKIKRGRPFVFIWNMADLSRRAIIPFREGIIRHGFISIFENANYLRPDNRESRGEIATLSLSTTIRRVKEWTWFYLVIYHVKILFLVLSARNCQLWHFTFISDRYKIFRIFLTY